MVRLKSIAEIFTVADELTEIATLKFECERHGQKLFKELKGDINLYKFRVETQKLHLLCRDRAVMREVIYDQLGHVFKNESIKVTDGVDEKPIDLPLLYSLTHVISQSSKIPIELACEGWTSETRQFWTRVATNMGLGKLANSKMVLGRLKILYKDLLSGFDNLPAGYRFLIGFVEEGNRIFERDSQGKEILLESWLENPKEMDFDAASKYLLSVNAETCALSRISCEMSATQYFLNLLKDGYPMTYAVRAFSKYSDGKDNTSNFDALSLREHPCFRWYTSNDEIKFCTQSRDFWSVYEFLKEKEEAGVPFISVDEMQKSLKISVKYKIQKPGDLIIVPSFCFYFSLCCDFSISESVCFPTKSWWSKIYDIMSENRSVEFSENDSLIRWPNLDLLLQNSYRNVISDKNISQEFTEGLFRTCQRRKFFEEKNTNLEEP